MGALCLHMKACFSSTGLTGNGQVTSIVSHGTKTSLWQSSASLSNFKNQIVHPQSDITKEKNDETGFFNLTK